MEGRAELRAMWEFPATWKLVKLLSRPLSFSAPSPSQLENALLNPSENLAMIADMHGRLLGLSAGASAAKKWMQYTSRFVRNRPDDFAFLLTEEPNSERSKNESSEAEMKEEPVDEEVVQKEEADVVQFKSAPKTSKPFPTEEDAYFRLRASTRLLVLYSIAEVVVSEHDSLLYAGSIADLDLDELRQYPIGIDAVGNRYWYFGDLECLYREPGRKTFKTRRQKADEDAKAANEAAKAAAARAAKLAKEEKRKEAERKREEIKRKREERKRKSMEKWGPRVAASRTTRASSRAETHLFVDSGASPPQPSADPSDKNEAMNIDSDPVDHEGEETGAQAKAQLSSDKGRSSAMDVQRRTSGRRRKAPTTEPTSVPVRTPKRPRRNERFADPKLRSCENWELISTGSAALRELIDRFQSEAGGVLSSEKALVRFLEDELLPEILENEAKSRKEQERLERKLRNEVMFSVQKRSSRVQALEQKREEEARRAAEEEERERLRLQRIAEVAENVKAQVAVLEKEQSRGIRIARRTHGRTEAIERDDQLHSVKDRKAARRESSIEETIMRRSTRSLRGAQRTSNEGALRSAVLKDAEAQGASKELLGASEVRSAGEENHFNPEDPSQLNGLMPSDEVEVVKNIAIDEMAEADSGIRDVDGGLPDKDDLIEPVAAQANSPGNGKDVGLTSAGSDKTIVDGRSEVRVNNSYTWSINPDDKEPIRVLDKFFFASKANFADAPLETCDTDQSHIIGFGVLLPPPDSTANAKLVQIDKVNDWVIEYGLDHKLWVKSEHAWYELRDPSMEYRDAFVSTRRKYEICIRIAILGATYKPVELTYESVTDLLSYLYEDMLSYSTFDILQEKRFIVAQMENLGRRPLLQSGFIRELKKKIKAEDIKTGAEVRRANALQQQTDSRVGKEQKSAEVTDGPSKRDKKTGDGLSTAAKVRTKRRSSSTARPVVPRAVSSIISSLLRAATKSQAPVRKRKRKQNALQDKPLHTAQALTNIAKLNGMNGRVPTEIQESNPLNSTQATNGPVEGQGFPKTNGSLLGIAPSVTAEVDGSKGNGLSFTKTTPLQSKRTTKNQNIVNLSAPTDPINPQANSLLKKPHEKSPSRSSAGHPNAASAAPNGKSQLPLKSFAGGDGANLSRDLHRFVPIAPMPTDEARGHTEENGLVHAVINGIADHVNDVGG